MGKYPLKRSLIVGIVFLFLSTICIPVLASEGKPDLVISDIFIWSSNEPYIYIFKCSIKNIGDAPIWWGDYDIQVKVFWMLFGRIPLLRINSHTDSAYISGYLFGDLMFNFTFISCESLPKFGTYRFYLEVNPHQKIEESNFDNNKYSEDWQKVFFRQWKEI